MPDANEAVRTVPAPPSVAPQPGPPAPPAAPPRTRFGWLMPIVRVTLVVGAGILAWYVAGNGNRWTGAVRYESTDDAYTAGDVTPLSAKVSGYIAAVHV